MKLIDGHIRAEKKTDLFLLGMISTFTKTLNEVWTEFGWDGQKPLRTVLNGHIILTEWLLDNPNVNESQTNVDKVRQVASWQGSQQQRSLNDFLKTHSTDDNPTGKALFSIHDGVLRPTLAYLNFYGHPKFTGRNSWSESVEGATNLDTNTWRNRGMEVIAETYIAGLFGRVSTLRQFTCFITILYLHACGHPWVKLRGIGKYLNISTNRIVDTLEPFIVYPGSQGRYLTLRKNPRDKRIIEVQWQWPNEYGEIFRQTQERLLKTLDVRDDFDPTKTFKLLGLVKPTDERKYTFLGRPI